jgi:hypothetical protein
MEKEKIQKAIVDIRFMGLTADEKRTMLARIIGGDQPALGNMSHISSWTTVVWRTFLVRQSWSSTFVVAALILMLAGGGVAFAAEATLPGDKLYPVKVELTEPLRDSLAFSVSAKAYLEELKIERRLKEAAKLAAQGRLTDSVNAQIQKRIEASAVKMGHLVKEAIK